MNKEILQELKEYAEEMIRLVNESPEYNWKSQIPIS